MINDIKHSKEEIEKQCSSKIKELGLLCYNRAVDRRELPSGLIESVVKISGCLNGTPSRGKKSQAQSLDDAVEETGYLCYSLYIDRQLTQPDLIGVCNEIEAISGRIRAIAESIQPTLRETDNAFDIGASKADDDQLKTIGGQNPPDSGDRNEWNMRTMYEQNPPWKSPYEQDPPEQDLFDPYGQDSPEPFGAFGQNPPEQNPPYDYGQNPYEQNMQGQFPPEQEPFGSYGQNPPYNYGQEPYDQNVPGQFPPEQEPFGSYGQDSSGVPEGSDFKMHHPYGMEPIPVNYIKCKCGYRNRSYANYCGKCGMVIMGEKKNGFE